MRRLPLGMRYYHESLADDGIGSSRYALKRQLALSDFELRLLAAIIEQAIADHDPVIHAAMGLPLPLPRLSKRAAAMLARFPRGVWFQPHELVELGLFPDRVKARTFLYSHAAFFEYRYQGRWRVWRLRPEQELNDSRSPFTQPY